MTIFSPCCVWLRINLERVGDDGIAVAAAIADETPIFYLQARPITYEHARALPELTRDPAYRRAAEVVFKDQQGRSIPRLVQMRVVLSFCPGCGADLSGLAETQPREFEALTLLHAKFIDD